MTATRHRPPPALRHHRGVGQAYCRFKVRGRPVVVYFGVWGPHDDCRPATYRRYAAWVATWPAPLDAARRRVAAVGAVVPHPSAARDASQRWV